MFRPARPWSFRTRIAPGPSYAQTRMNVASSAATGGDPLAVTDQMSAELGNPECRTTVGVVLLLPTAPIVRDGAGRAEVAGRHGPGRGASYD